MGTQIHSLLAKGVIVPAPFTPGEFVSNVFLRPKPDGYRLILNLKDLNDAIVYRHFKMETLKTVLDLVTPGCYMACLDWKDAYYSVPVHPAFQKYLTFVWQGVRYKFVCLPNGLSSAPRLFTKLTKPLFATLRKRGHMNCPYIDDAWLVGDTASDCRANIKDSVQLSMDCGFVVHPTKSVLVPTQNIIFIGFVLDSVRMTVSLTDKKKLKLRDSAIGLLDSVNPPIAQVAELVGQMVASFPGVPYAQLFYRQLDIEKSRALKRAAGAFTARMTLSDLARDDLQWWIDNILNSCSPIRVSSPSKTLRSDSSSFAWGGLDGHIQTGGNWSVEEREEHINYLELLAAKLTFQTFGARVSNTHIRIQLDNTTAVAYINRQGGRKIKCNALARELWRWCYDRRIWLSATHLPGVANVQADYLSRTDHDNTEWRLDPSVFVDITEFWDTPTVDLFASRLNFQVQPYVSWKPDPGALAVDAFSIVWSEFRLTYIFPPFALINRVLCKITQEQAEAIVIVPCWATQPWFPKLLRMLTDCPFLLPRCQDILQHPSKDVVTLPRMRLLACRLSGNPSAAVEFRKQLLASSCTHGDAGLGHNIVHTYTNGSPITVKDIAIHFHLL